MQNYKVEVKSKEEQLEAVYLFIKYGHERKLGNIPSFLHKFVFADESGEILISSIDSGEKQITLQELRSMVEPKQKEYLVKTDTGHKLQVLSDVVDGHDGIIEVPDGAEKLIYSKENNNNYHFVNAKNELWCVTTNDKKWYECSITYNGYFNGFGCVVVWQRESLNDQVASAEQARQEQAKTREVQESDLIFGVQGITVESIPVGMMHHGFTQPEELPFVGDEPKLKNIKIRVNGDFDKALETIQSMGYWNCHFESIPRDCYWLLGNEDATVDYGSTEYLYDDENYVDYFIEDNAWNKQIGGDHYKKLAIQPMEYALQNKLDYAQANVVKYVTRHADKNGKQDLLKAIHNIELMIAHYYSDQE